jgi:hypothetical protein
VSTNNNQDTHIYNIINNPPKVFTEPCEACGVSEFQLGVKHAEERIIKLLEKYEVGGSYPDTYNYIPHEQLIALIKGEQK